jgi:hypothetical protein
MYLHTKSRLATLAATAALSICSIEAAAGQACCIDTLYCIITQPEICDSLGGTLRPDPNGTCADWPASPCSNGAAGLQAPVNLRGGFGASMDLEFSNGHVDHLVVGSPDADDARGGASVMTWQVDAEFGGSWVQDFSFDLDTSSFNPGDHAGASVATDGIWIAVGIPGQKEVRIFQNENGLWNERQTLTPISDGETDDAFGLTLALDGSTLFIGAEESSPSGGRVSIFTTNGGTEEEPWVFEQHLTSVDGGTLGFGRSMALNDVQGRAVIGAPYGGGGEAYSVLRVKSGWEIVRALSADLPAQYGEFGTSVEILGDVAYIGNPGMTISGPTQGVIWAFMFGENGVEMDYHLSTFVAPPQGSTGSQFGASLSLQPGALLVGSPDEGGTGAVHIYTHPYKETGLIHLTWSAQINGADEGDMFGSSLAVGALGGGYSGGLALTSSPGASSMPDDIPAAGRIDTINMGDLNAGDGSFRPPVQFARTIAYENESAPLQAIEHQGEWCIAGWPTRGTQGGIHLFNYENGTWNPVGDMVHGTAVGFGQSIAMLNGIAAIGSPQENGAGAVHLYTYSELGLVELTSLQPSSMNEAAAGSSLALAENPNGDMVLAIGAPGMDMSSPYAYPVVPGALYVYGRLTGTSDWFLSFTNEDDPNNPGGWTGLGHDVEAAWYADVFNVLGGCPYKYDNAGEVVHCKGTLSGTPFNFFDNFSVGGTGMRFGSSLKLEQNTLVVGGPGASPEFPYGTVHVLRYYLDGFENIQGTVLQPRTEEATSNGARYGSEVDAHTIDDTMYIAIGMPQLGGVWNLEAPGGGAVDLYAGAIYGGAGGHVEYVRQARILPRNAQFEDQLGGAISFADGRLLFANGAQNNWLKNTPSPTFLSHETAVTSYWTSPQGGDITDAFKWSLPPQAGGLIVFSLLESTTYFVGGFGATGSHEIQVMFDSPIFSTQGHEGPANMTSLLVASDAEIRSASVLIDGDFNFSDVVQLGGYHGSIRGCGGMHIYGASQVHTNNFTQKANGQLMISITDAGWDVGDPSFVLAEIANIQGSLTLNIEGTHVNQLKLGDRINLLQSEAIANEHDRFDLVVFPGLPDGLALTMAYGEGERGSDQWLAYAEVVSLAGLLDFGDPNSVPVTGNPISVETVDLTGDGADEICVLFDGSPGSLAIFENDGLGGISQQITIPTCDSPTDITSGDFDADGNNDLAISCSGDLNAGVDGTITIFYNEDLDLLNGFENSYVHPFAGSPICLTAVDWDDTPPEDLAVGGALSEITGIWQVLLASSLRSGEMTDGPSSNANGIPIDIGGKPEDEEAPKDANIRFAGTTNLGNVSVGKQVFRRSERSIQVDDYVVSSDLRGVVFSDLNNDGRLDITAVSGLNGQLAILFGDLATGDSFSNPTYVNAGTSPSNLVSVDFDQDGNLDLATITTADDGQRIIRVFQNDGNLIFTIVEVGSGEQPVLLDTGDISGNEIAELVTIGAGTLRGTGGNGMLSLRTVDGISTCQGDVNGDAVVDVLDLLDVISAWGPCAGCPEDIDHNGSVDVIDLLAIISAWGECNS